MRPAHSLSISNSLESGFSPNILRLWRHRFNVPVARSSSQQPAGIVELIIDIFRGWFAESCQGRCVG